MRRLGQPAVLAEQPLHAAGDGRCGVDQLYRGVGDHLLDDVREEGVVGTAQDDAVGAGRQQRGHGPFDQSPGGGRVLLVGLDGFDKSFTHGRYDPYAGSVASAQLAEPVAAERGTGGQDADCFRFGGCGSGLYGRFHADEGERIGGAQVFDGRHGRRVAGQHDQFAVVRDEGADGLVDVADHLGGRLFAIGTVKAVPEVDEGFVRKPFADFAPDGESAHAGVEDAYRSIVHDAQR